MITWTHLPRTKMSRNRLFNFRSIIYIYHPFVIHTKKKWWVLVCSDEIPKRQAVQKIPDGKLNGAEEANESDGVGGFFLLEEIFLWVGFFL